MERFLMHPLFIRVESNSICLCQVPIPNAHAYTLRRPVFKPNPHTRPDVFEMSFHTWLDRRRLQPMSPRVGIINPKRKHMYLVDLVAESYTGDIVFILFYNTERRAVKRQKKFMYKYARDVKKHAMEIFKIEPVVMCVNAYSHGKLASFVVD